MYFLLTGRIQAGEENPQQPRTLQVVVICHARFEPLGETREDSGETRCETFLGNRAVKPRWR